MGVQQEDQRRHPRVGVRQRVWCEGENLSLYVQALNMSLGGAFIQSVSWTSQEHFQLSFSYEEQPIVMEVEVVWERKQRSPSGIGVQIVRFEKGEDTYRHFLSQVATPEQSPPKAGEPSD